MLSVEKVATPATAAAVVVPESVPTPGFWPMATVTLAVKPSAVFPNASRAVTSTGGVIVAPAVTVLGCTLKASRLAGPAITLKNALETPGKPGLAADSLYRPPLLSMLRLEKIATPATAAIVVVPESVAPLVPVPGSIVSVTVPVKLAAVWPEASRAVTSSAGVNTTPAVARCAGWVGWTVKPGWVGVEGMMSKPALVAPDGPGAVAE